MRAVYMAPEVFQREYGLEADMWSLGMMLYQCMTCRFPFWPSIEACRQKSLDEVARAVILDDISLNFGPWLSMTPEVCTLVFAPAYPGQRPSKAQMRKSW